MAEPVDTAGLWAAVDAITKETVVRVQRDALEDTWWLSVRDRCDVAAHRAVTISHGTVPSLWEQAEQAIMTGRESAGGTGASPKAERSLADLNLMETLLTIRESMEWQLPGRGIVNPPTVPGQIRRLAAHVAGYEAVHVPWWTYRFAQWARILGEYLQATEHGPRPVRLRNAPCPKCGVRQVVIEEDGDTKVVPPLLVDFEHGWIRAAQCIACGYTKWRGQDLWDLADELANQPRKTSDESETLTA